MTNVKLADDQTLLANLFRLAKAEAVSQVESLCHLAEVDERRIVVERGYSGMWDFCRRGLGFSESTSTRRISVARAARSYPEILAMLADRRLTLCTAADLVPLLDQANHEQLLAAAAGKSRREVQGLGVAANAKAVERDVIRRVPGLSQAEAPVVAAAPLGLVEHRALPGPTPGVSPGKAISGKVLHRVAFTADQEVVAKLERLQEILGDVTLAEVCDRAADLLLEKLDPVRRQARRESKKQASATKSKSVPTKTQRPKATEPRRAPRALVDEVIAAAGSRCEYISTAGFRCAETRYLTADHVRPYALGGRSRNLKNLRCYCSAHNLFAGRKSFGPNNVHQERKNEAGI